MESFSGVKCKSSPTETEADFYDLLLERLEAASDRKIKQDIDEVSKKMTIHFEGIPANVLGHTWEKTTSGYSMLPVYKDFIGNITMSGIVDPAFINKAQMTKVHPAALDILFRVILPIFVRIDVYLRNSVGLVADEEFISMIRRISDEEWTLSSCAKVNKDLVRKYWLKNQQKAVGADLMASDDPLMDVPTISELVLQDELAGFESQIKSSVEQKETQSFSGLDGIPMPSPAPRSMDEYLRCPVGSLADADKKRKCIVIGSRHYGVRVLSLKKKKKLLKKPVEIKMEEGTFDAEPRKLSPVNVITVEDDKTSAQCSSPNVCSLEPVVLPPTTNDSQHVDMDYRVKKEVSPEVEIVGEKMVTPETKKARWSKPSADLTAYKLKQIKNCWVKGSPVNNNCSTKNVLIPATQEPVAVILPPRPALLNTPSVSSFTTITQPPPGGPIPHIWSNPSIGRMWSATPVIPSSSGAAEVLAPSVPPLLFVSTPLPQRQLRLKEIETMVAVLRKVAWGMESELLENSEALPESISFTSSIGNPETTLFVGYSVRKSNDPVCYSEGRYWSLVQLYQSLQHVFPPFVLDDIRNAAVNGLLGKVDHILTNTKPLFDLTALKIKELARLAHFAKSGDLHLVVQQRLAITQTIENASRAFWGTPAPCTGTPRFP